MYTNSTCVLSSDPSFNPQNLRPVFRAITGDIKSVDIPSPRAGLFREKFSGREDQLNEAGKYCALYHPDPNWKWLSHRLYKAGETVAVDLAKPHIQTVTGTIYMFTCT